jgi:lauroyl/myristoyl acyltransferase
MLVTETQPQAIGDRPLVAWKDLIWLFGYRPLVWAARVLPAWAFRLLENGSAAVYRLLTVRQRRAAAEIMSRRLGAPLAECEDHARALIRNGVRKKFVEVRALSGKLPLAGHEVALLGREHLDRALANGRGVILVTIHGIANGPAKLALRAMGYSVLTVQNYFPFPMGHGRLWCRLAEPWYRGFRSVIAPAQVSPQEPDCVMAVTRHLRGNGIVMITPDARRAITAARVPFLDGERLLSFGVLGLARLNGCDLLPLQAYNRGGELLIEFRPPLELRTDVAARDHMAANRPVLAAEIERQIRAHPDQWELWLLQ